MTKDELDRIAEELMAGDNFDDVNTEFETEINDLPVHIIDNGAFNEIADTAPVTPDEYDATFGLTPEDEGDAPAQHHDEVLGEDGQIIGSEGDVIRGSDSTDGLFRDDFDELARRRAKASYGPNGELLDDFHRLYLEQNAATAEVNAVAPHTRDTPPSWGTGISGQSVQVSTGASFTAAGLPGVVPDGAPTTAAYWQGEDSDSCAVTVTLTPIQTLFATNGIPTRPFAVVTFGTRAFTSQVIVDVGQGCEFVVSGSTVLVDLGLNGGDYRNYSVPPADGTVQSMVLAAMIAPKAIYRQTPITRTLYVDPKSAPIVGASLHVPSFAKRLTAWVGDLTTDITIRLVDSAGQVVAEYVQTHATFMTAPMPIPNDAVVVALGFAASLVTCRVIFELSL